MLEIPWAPPLLVPWNLANLLVHKLQIQVCLLLRCGAGPGDNMGDNENMLAKSSLPALLAVAK